MRSTRPSLVVLAVTVAGFPAPGVEVRAQAPASGTSATPTPYPPELPPLRAGVFAGTLTKLDLGRRAVVILVPATTGDAPVTPATEVELRVTGSSKLVWRGRDVAFEDLRTDSKVAATWRDGADRRRELVLLRIR